MLDEKNKNIKTTLQSQFLKKEITTFRLRFSFNINRLKENNYDLAMKAHKAKTELEAVKPAVINACPNRRVVYLALHGKNKKIRKKNVHRAIKILEEM